MMILRFNLSGKINAQKMMLLSLKKSLNIKIVILELKDLAKSEKKYRKN